MPKYEFLRFQNDQKCSYLRIKMSKFEKLEPKNPKNIHFCAEKVTKIKNYYKYIRCLVPLWHSRITVTRGVEVHGKNERRSVHVHYSAYELAFRSRSLKRIFANFLNAVHVPFTTCERRSERRSFERRSFNLC